MADSTLPEQNNELKKGQTTAGGNADTSSLDFSDDHISVGQPSAPEVGRDYDPRPQEGDARRRIAYLLIGLLWLVVSGILIMLSFGSIKVTEVKELGVVLSPLITLVSAATGFYYGTKSNSTPTFSK